MNTFFLWGVVCVGVTGREGLLEKTLWQCLWELMHFTASGSHHLEFSLVTTPYIYRYKTISSQQDLSDKYVYIATTAGYRYQRPMGRLFFKVSAGPLLSLDPPSDHFWRMDPTLFVSAYLSAGFAF